MDSTAWALLVGAAAAGFVQGLSGFAFGLVANSIWAWWLSPQLAATMAVFGALTGQLLAVASVRRGLQWPRLWPLLAGGLCGLPLGLWLLPRLDGPSFQLAVGGLLVVWCPVMLALDHLPPVRSGGRWADALAGAGGGFTGAVGGFTGPLPTLWCTLRGWDKDTLRAVVQNFNLVMLAVTFASYLATGVVGPRLLPQFALVAAAVLLPVLFGARLYARISAPAFRRVVLVLLALSGVALLLRSVPVVLQRAA